MKTKTKKVQIFRHISHLLIKEKERQLIPKLPVIEVCCEPVNSEEVNSVSLCLQYCQSCQFQLFCGEDKEFHGEDKGFCGKDEGFFGKDEGFFIFLHLCQKSFILAIMFANVYLAY